MGASCGAKASPKADPLVVTEQQEEESATAPEILEPLKDEPANENPTSLATEEVKPLAPIAKNVSGNLPTARVEEEETGPEENPPDQEQTSFQITEIYYRRAEQDIAVIAFGNEKRHTYPLSLLKVELDGKKYITNVLSFSEEHIRVFLPKSLSANMKAGDVVKAEVIRHELPINLPTTGVFAVGHAFSIALLIQLQKIYKLEKSKCECLTLCHKEEDLIFKSSLKDVMPCKSIELENTEKCVGDLVEYFKQQLLKKGYMYFICIGPNWLLEIAEKLARDKDLERIKFYGLQNVMGTDQETEPIVSFSNLRLETIFAAKIEPEEVEMEKIVEQMQKEWAAQQKEEKEELEANESAEFKTKQ